MRRMYTQSKIKNLGLEVLNAYIEDDEVYFENPMNFNEDVWLSGKSHYTNLVVAPTNIKSGHPDSMTTNTMYFDGFDIDDYGTGTYFATLEGPSQSHVSCVLAGCQYTSGGDDCILMSGTFYSVADAETETMTISGNSGDGLLALTITKADGTAVTWSINTTAWTFRLDRNSYIQ